MKKIYALLLTATVLINLTGCYDVEEISYTVAAIALGIDKGENMQYSVSFQIEKSGSNTEENEEEKKQIELITVEAPTVSAAYERANDMSSVHISIDNLKMVLLSEELCREGIRRIVSELMCDMNLKNNAAMAVTATTAEEMLEKIAPEDEEYISSFYQRVLFNKYKITTDFFLIEEVYFNLLSETGQDIMLPMVNYRGASGANEEKIKIGAMHKEEGFETEFFGGALFRDGVMNGYLSELDMMAAALIYGDFKSQKVSVEYPEGSGEYVVIELKQQRPPSIETKTENGNISENIKLKLTATYQYVGESKSYGEFNLRFTEYLKNEINALCMNLIEKTVKKEGADVISVGKRLRKCFWNNKSLEEFNYKNKISDGNYEVFVFLDMKNGGRFVFK